MIPVSPVLLHTTKKHEIIIAKDQREYMPLPSAVLSHDLIATRWRFESDIERKAVLDKNNQLTVFILNHSQPIQPVRLMIHEPAEPFDKIQPVKLKDYAMQQIEECCLGDFPLTHEDRILLYTQGWIYFLIWKKSNEPLLPVSLRVMGTKEVSYTSAVH